MVRTMCLWESVPGAGRKTHIRDFLISILILTEAVNQNFYMFHLSSYSGNWQKPFAFQFIPPPCWKSAWTVYDSDAFINRLYYPQFQSGMPDNCSLHNGPVNTKHVLSQISSTGLPQGWFECSCIISTCVVFPVAQSLRITVRFRLTIKSYRRRLVETMILCCPFTLLPPPKQIPPQPAQVPSFTNGSTIQLQTARSRYIVFSI